MNRGGWSISQYKEYCESLETQFLRKGIELSKLYKRFQEVSDELRKYKMEKKTHE